MYMVYKNFLHIKLGSCRLVIKKILNTIQVIYIDENIYKRSYNAFWPYAIWVSFHFSCSNRTNEKVHHLNALYSSDQNVTVLIPKFDMEELNKSKLWSFPDLKSSSKYVILVICSFFLCKRCGKNQVFFQFGCELFHIFLVYYSGMKK